MVNKRLLILVPHQDDELNIAGQVLPTFVEAGYECKLCFSTNGDGFKSNGPVRLREAMRVAGNLGLSRDNLILLGFADCMGPDHPYKRITEQEIISSPLTMTYSDRIPSYSEVRCGAPQHQCKTTLIADLEHLLLDFLPSTVICIDYDSHPDHRALSLAFEAALGNILRVRTDYAPLVLKKFAYSSLWYGPADYSKFLPTIRPVPNGKFELDNPMYTWRNRICVAPHPSTLTKSFFRNDLVKAACKYRSQNAWWFMYSVCNSDVVFWCRRTDNLIFKSTVKTSSGSPLCLKDFLLFDSTDICSDDISVYSHYGLSFDEADESPRVELTFDSPTPVAEIIVRESVCSFNKLNGIAIEIDDTVLTMTRVGSQPGVMMCSFSLPRMVHSVKLIFDGSQRASIASIEIYPSHIDEYSQLQMFEDLMGKPGEHPSPHFSCERGLRQAARATRKIEHIRLIVREKRLKRWAKR